MDRTNQPNDEFRPRSYWSDKCVVITGASSGIGHALALHLAERGAAIGLIARTTEALEQLAAAIRAKGGSAHPAIADVTDAEQLRAAAAAIASALGDCDVVIANAGINRDTPGHAFPTHEAARIIDTNVQGVINTIDAFVPGMVERRSGHFVAIASLAAMIGLPAAGAYCASKAAVVTLMESLELDLHRYGIKVLTVCPGFVDTPLVAHHKRKDLSFLISAEDAAGRITRAIERGRRRCPFPWQTTALIRLARLMPFWLYRRIIRKLAAPKPPKMPKT